METKRGTLLGVAAVGVVVAGMIGFAWVAFPAAADSRPAVDSLAARLDAVEEKVKEWPKERNGLSSRIYQNDKSATAGIRRARAENTALVEGLRREMNRNIESTQREAHDEIVRLQEELAAMRRELDALRKETSPEVFPRDR
jgi:Mg2+ and Co2+ transporter CorA